MSVQLRKQDYTLGALYYLGAVRGFSRDTMARLMVDRAGLSKRAAQQLVAHWVSTEPYRKRQEGRT